MDSQPQLLRLLLVEDHVDLAEATAQFLQAAGLEVRVANSGEEALNAAETFRPDILLCDLHLQDMSGLDVARKIRSQLERKETLIALYSGLSTHDIRILERESRPAGVQLFSPKPLTEESVKRLLDGYAALQRSLALDGRESDALKTPS